MKGLSKWSKRMVGHMEVVCYFYNMSKGIWHVNLLDLLTEEAERQIYNSLYRKNVESDFKRTIYGEKGAAIYSYEWWSGNYEITEVNLGFDRYVAAISGTSYFSEKDLIRRLESLQFTKGGYVYFLRPACKIACKDTTFLIYARIYSFLHAFCRFRSINPNVHLEDDSIVTCMYSTVFPTELRNCRNADCSMTMVPRQSLGWNESEGASFRRLSKKRIT